MIRPLTDAPHLRFVTGARFSTDHRDFGELTIATVRPHPDGVLTVFEQVSDRDAAESLRGTTLSIMASERRALDVDEFWPEDLIGLSVEDRSGSVLGSVSAVVHGAAQDRIAVRTAGGELVEVPFVAALVPEVRLDDAVIVVDPPEGMF